MDANRVNSYLQVACAGLGFDIGEVWSMSNESGTSTVASITDTTTTNTTSSAAARSGHESDSSGEDTYHQLMNQEQPSTAAAPTMRFLQLYTSKAYRDQRSKLVQPHDIDENDGHDDSKQAASSSANTGSTSSSSQQLTLHNNNKNHKQHPSEESEHVLSPRIVDAVTHTAQVVWANCQSTQAASSGGLLGRSDIKLQTAIGMPVGVDDAGNVWVVVMFSPKNVESSSDAIDYLQYISRSAASTSIPCLLPVVGEPDESVQQKRRQNGGAGSGAKMLTDGSDDDDDGEDDATTQQPQQQHLHLLSMKPKAKQTNTTQDLGEGVTAKFVSFNLNDENDDEYFASTGIVKRSPSNNELCNAPKDDFGIPMLPPSAVPHSISGDSVADAITDAFDEASYGVWSTIMNSAGGEAIRTSETIATKMHLIQERLEEFANAFLGMSVFDVADAWISSSSVVGGEEGSGAVSGGIATRSLKCLFTVAATELNPRINAFREASANASIKLGDGAVGKAYSTGYPVWSSVKVRNLQFDPSRCVMIFNQFK